MRFLTVFGMTDTVSGRWRGEKAGAAPPLPTTKKKTQFENQPSGEKKYKNIFKKFNKNTPHI
jgi:hypothetical protein